MARYEYSDGYTPDGALRGAHKFWEIELLGTKVVTRYGRIGSRGQRRTKVFESDEAARREAVRSVARKEQQGYKHVSSSPPPPSFDYEPPPRARHPDLLAQIHRRPYDPSAYLVYADYLQTEGDPTGELIALGHAMFHEHNIKRFVALQKRWHELKVEHKRHFFGGLTECLNEVKLDWRFGLVREAKLTRSAPDGYEGPYDEALVESVLAAPVCCALQSLHLEDPAANIHRILSMLAERAPPSLHALAVAPEYEFMADLPAPLAPSIPVERSLVAPAYRQPKSVDITDIVRAMPSLRQLAIGSAVWLRGVPRIERVDMVAHDVLDDDEWPDLLQLGVRWTTGPLALARLVEHVAYTMPKLEALTLTTRFTERAVELIDVLPERVRSLELIGEMPPDVERAFRRSDRLSFLESLEIRPTR